MSDPYTAEYLTKFRTAELTAAAEHRRLARDLRLAGSEQVDAESATSRRYSLRLRLPRLHLRNLHVGH